MGFKLYNVNCEENLNKVIKLIKDGIHMSTAKMRSIIKRLLKKIWLSTKENKTFYGNCRETSKSYERGKVNGKTCKL